MKNKNFNAGGFTLMEAIISIAVFSIIIVAASGILAAAVKNKHASNEYNQSSEEMIDAINLIAKKVRMGEITDSSSSSIKIKDSGDGHTYEYAFSGNNLKFGQDSATDILVEDVSGRFYVSSDIPKKMTIFIKINKAGVNSPTIQTTVSNRIYNQ